MFNQTVNKNGVKYKVFELNMKPNFCRMVEFYCKNALKIIIIIKPAS